MSAWTPEHWLVVLGFFSLMAVCVFILVTRPTVQVPGIPSHDLANRVQACISDLDMGARDMPRPREVREISDRVQALERVTTGMQSDVRAMRDSNGRIEHQLNLLMAAGLEREARGTTT